MSNGFGITDTGFVRKTITDIKDEKDAQLRVVLGPTVNLAPQTPQGQLSQNSTLSDNELWEIAEGAYNATDPDRATGVALSNLVKLNRITRQEALATSVMLNCTGTANVTVQAGQRVSNGAGRTVLTREAFTFNQSGMGNVLADLVTEQGELLTGPIPIDAATMTSIETPVSGWDTVTNTLAGTLGRNREEDGPLRIRRARSTAASSQNLLESMIGALGDITGVTSLTVLENDSDTTDSDGVPAHSFEVIITGGSDGDIVNTIWANKPFGIGSFGSSSAIVNDSQGLPHTIRFTRPTLVPIFVDITLNKRTGYPADGDDTIKQAIVDYANGVSVAGRGFPPGSNVIYSELYTPINTVPNHDITALTIGISANPTGEVNIPITIRQASQFLVANINIT